ncbi:unnamed protein product [Alopecurus aequalis]
MTGDSGTQGRWSDDLPGDLLGAIYHRCSSSYERCRFAAVCTSWRAAASWQPKLPALPLLLPSTRNGWFDRKALAYSPEDGRVLRAPLPCFPYGKRIVGSYDGGWVAGAIGCRITIVNLFTGARVLHKEDIPCWGSKFSTQKIIFSKDPASVGCIVAAMSTSSVALFSLSGPAGAWTKPEAYRMLHVSKDPVDIAFCNGELYVLSSYNGYGDLVLCKLAIGLDKGNVPTVISREKINIRRHATFRPRYIFELGGKLATAGEVGPVSNGKARTFRVFEVISSSDTIESYEWAEVASLGDHALFLGSGCCKAVHISSAICGKVERNCIYYSEKEEQDPEGLARLDLGSCAVYCYENKGVDPSKEITSRGYHYPEKGHEINDRNTCTWIFPPNY